MNGVDRALRSPIGWAVLLVLAVLACASVFTIVPETQQALVVRMGVPQTVVNRFRPGERLGETGAGLIARVPLIDQVVLIDKRVRTIDLEDQVVGTGDGRSIAVDAFARYRIVDPVRMYRATAGDSRRLADALKPVLGAALRAELGRLPAAGLLAPERSPAMRAVVATLNQAARQYGATVSEVRLDGTALPAGAALDGTVARMRDAREQQALQIRDDGYKQAMTIRAQGDADASKIYADAYGQDADFYDFYRAMQSYRSTFGVDRATDGSTQLVIGADSGYFRQLHNGGKQ